MNKGAELLGGRLAGEHNNPASVPHPKRQGDALLELKRDALGDDAIGQTLPLFSDISAQLARKLGELPVVGLAQIKDVGRTKANEYTLIQGADILLGSLILLAPDSNDGSKNADSLLTFH